ncbi:hypothetical protein GCM10025881_15550 [Pseudolysinimonas kribbensis]|uniref:NADP-dependent oxidoreductase domain-containing protein n=1 Tax=Pseudolysinimonas kribbensis TaxID=433641 RepID=A0ABQ6K7K5_9MICO|nr:aldo/keto reductase [Pseudolysinimonas kribbensis]GMA94731.1 hypothetical protein GCM10025881_15550 [Pseudolysinimonas kribbensis]
MSGRLPDRELGSTGLVLSSVTLGGGPLGSMLENFGYEVAEEQAIELVGDVLRSEIRTIDTANGYSAGRSERRIGTAIARFGLPDDVVVVTKVDADGRDYSGDRVRASLRESRERLGLPGPLPLVHLHDPEFHDFADLTALGGAVDALVEARESGAVSHIGLAGVAFRTCGAISTWASSTCSSSTTGGRSSTGAGATSSTTRSNAAWAS